MIATDDDRESPQGVLKRSGLYFVIVATVYSQLKLYHNPDGDLNRDGLAKVRDSAIFVSVYLRPCPQLITAFAVTPPHPCHLAAEAL